MTLPDGTYTATIDRIEEGVAVLLIEDRDADDVDAESDREVVDEVHCPADELSSDARAESGVVSVRLVDGEVADVERRPQATRRRRAEIQERFDRLAERPPCRDEDT